MTAKPAPVPSPESEPFWNAVNEDRLIYQFCIACDRAQYYPRILCSHCGSRAVEWHESERHCTIHAVTHVHIGIAAFKADAPYTIVLVDMAEGFRMLCNLVGDGVAEATIGDRGMIVFKDRDGIKMPQFQKSVEKML